jgi:hypothetical protein
LAGASRANVAEQNRLLVKKRGRRTTKKQAGCDDACGPFLRLLRFVFHPRFSVVERDSATHLLFNSQVWQLVRRFVRLPGIFVLSFCFHCFQPFASFLLLFLPAYFVDFNSVNSRLNTDIAGA